MDRPQPAPDPPREAIPAELAAARKRFAETRVWPKCPYCGACLRWADGSGRFACFFCD